MSRRIPGVDGPHAEATLVTGGAPVAVRSTWFPPPHEAPLSANEPALTSAVDCRIDPGDGHGLSDATMERIGERIERLLGDD